jgi:hypothetical protein
VRRWVFAAKNAPEGMSSATNVVMLRRSDSYRQCFRYLSRMAMKQAAQQRKPGRPMSVGCREQAD